MSRPLRLQVADGYYHVTARGNEKRDIYRDDVDRQAFMRVVAHALRRFRWQLLGFCLMPNHYHLVFRTHEPNLARGMRHVNSTYALAFNRRHGRVGHLFQGRYGAVLVQHDSHLLELLRYVALNPVRAGFCERAEDWPWSSHRGILGQGTPALLDVEAVLRLFDGHEDPRRAYATFVGDGATVVIPDPLPAAFGDADFVTARLPEGQPSAEIPRHNWPDVRPPLSDITAAAPTRESAIAEAYRTYGYTRPEIANALGCSISTVGRCLRRTS